MRYVLIAYALFPLAAHAGFNDLKAPIKPNSCRLANAYTMNGQDYSGSAGATSKGQYGTATSQADCKQKCEKAAAGRANSKPAIYGLRVACFYGNKKLFSEQYK